MSAERQPWPDWMTDADKAEATAAEAVIADALAPFAGLRFGTECTVAMISAKLTELVRDGQLPAWMGDCFRGPDGAA